MIAEFGHFLLVMACLASLAGGAASLACAGCARPFWRESWRPALAIAGASLAGSAAALAWAFLADDFSVAYVADNSNSSLAAGYKIAAFWGGHQGSMFLWILMTAGWAAAAGRLRCPDDFKARMQGALLLVIGGFLLFLLASSDPFLRNLPGVPPEGRDLNPVLQDIGMILHPPMLFMGYSGLAAMFAASAACLLGEGEQPFYWRAARSVTTAAWAFLTAGNALGSWWAYTELGWGGWWFWDPVENSSFVPWLMTTGLLHGLLLAERRGQCRAGCVLLAIAAFAMSLLGSFVVRSGVVQSVHAFASDPGRGVALLALSAALLAPALALFALRAPASDEQAEYDAAGLLLLGALALCVMAAASVLLGTLYPLLHDALGLGALTVGAAYFNQFFVPMVSMAAAAAGAAHLAGKPPLAWALCLAASLAAAAGVALGLAPQSPLNAALGSASAAWLASTALAGLLAPGRRAGAGALMAHVGLAVSIVGATAVSNFEQDAVVRMDPGGGRPLADVIFVMREVRDVETPSFLAKQATMSILDAADERELTRLYPQRQLFKGSGMQMTAAGIEHGLWRDLYVSMGNQLSPSEWLVRVAVKPLASWIWAGAGLMILGCLLMPLRRRKEAPCAR
ncbi:MAG: heme lyase NrfEFG subunit NrfE [Duodenibacillus sp.]|nr:heme lyase NrfEFG subunit NrfE [Duodenibacillus sp.]